MAQPQRPFRRQHHLRVALVVLGGLVAPLWGEGPHGGMDDRTAGVATAAGYLSTQRPEGVAGLVLVQLASGENPAEPPIRFPEARPTSMVAAAAVAMWGRKASAGRPAWQMGR